MYRLSNPKHKELYRHPRTSGGKATPEYVTYLDMMKRCYYQKHNRFHRYGGRGIGVCDRWRESFDNFRDDMGVKPNGLQLERKDNDADYSKDNCVWATRSAQANNRSSARLITFNGKTQSLIEWSNETGIAYNTLGRRINFSKMGVEKALTTPVGMPNGAPSKIYEADGRRLTIKEWASHLKCSEAALRHRLSRGWSIERTFTTSNLRTS